MKSLLLVGAGVALGYFLFRRQEPGQIVGFELPVFGGVRLA